MVLTGFVSAALLSSCATYKELGSDKKIAIETIGSLMARITRAGLYTDEENKIMLRGELKRRAFLRAPIPGHLDIELVNLKGKVVKSTQLEHRSRGGKSRISYFSIHLPVKPSLLSLVRIKHHNAELHRTKLKLSPWQAVNPIK